MRASFYHDSLEAIHRLLLDHDITRGCLSCAGVRLDGEVVHPDSRIKFALPDGSWLTGLEFAHLFSVFDGSRVHQQTLREVGLDGAPPGAYFSVVNSRFIQNQHKNKFGLILGDRGDASPFVKSLYIDHYFLDERKTKVCLGTIAFALIALTAYQAGLHNISLVAAGGKGHDRRFLGYKVWPKLGFDAVLRLGEADGPVELKACYTVQDVLRCNSNWWDENGSQRLMQFDLSPDSASWRKLISYVCIKLGI